MNSNLPLSELMIQLCNNAAQSFGLEFLGITSLNVEQDFQWFQSWLQESRHGEMGWLSNHLEIRKDPARLLEGAKSAFIFGFPYYLGPKHGRVHPDSIPEIAQYARLKDYHKFLRKKLNDTQKMLAQEVSATTSWRITVDSAPLLERALASQTNECFVGKNTCIIHPTKGSFFLLGEIISTLDLTSTQHLESRTANRKTSIDPSKRTENGGCGTCRRCQVHCPTGALDQDYRIDARKCLSYWTIEHRGTIPFEFWPWIGRYLFGCDICQNVCPYNRNVAPTSEAQSLVHEGVHLSLIELVRMDQQLYEQKFGGTPMTRAKRGGLRRNALIAGIAMNDPLIIQILDEFANDPDEVIRATVTQAKTYLEEHKNSDKI